MATHNKAEILPLVFESILKQSPPFEWELVVVDDSSIDDTPQVCGAYPKVRYHRIDRGEGFHNPAIPRNLSYKLASGDVLICQSDDVVHVSLNVIESLATGLKPGTFSIADVWNTDPEGNRKPLREWPSITQLTGPGFPRPFFFLGSILRSHMYEAGGNDELYTGYGCEDDAFAASLIHGLGLNPRYVDVLGRHLDHSRPANLSEMTQHSEARLAERKRACVAGEQSWLSPDPGWEYVAGQPLMTPIDPRAYLESASASGGLSNVTPDDTADVSNVASNAPNWSTRHARSYFMPLASAGRRPGGSTSADYSGVGLRASGC